MRRRPSDALRRFPTREASVVGRQRDVGDGAFGGAFAGLWECSVVGAAAAVHLWGAGGCALSLEGRWRRLPTCGRPHWSRAFNNAGNGHSIERGGDDEDGSARDGSARDGELVDSRGREAEASTQQPAS